MDIKWIKWLKSVWVYIYVCPGRTVSVSTAGAINLVQTSRSKCTSWPQASTRSGDTSRARLYSLFPKLVKKADYLRNKIRKNLLWLLDICYLIYTSALVLVLFISYCKNMKYLTLNLCPLQGAKNIDEEERKARASSGRECDIQLKNAIEGIIIKWAYQVIHKKI